MKKHHPNNIAGGNRRDAKLACLKDYIEPVIVKLCENGYDKNIMMSQDICYKHLLKKYGGYGYSHVIENIVPELRRHNVGENQIRNMLVENPKKILAF